MLPDSGCLARCAGIDGRPCDRLRQAIAHRDAVDRPQDPLSLSSSQRDCRLRKGSRVRDPMDAPEWYSCTKTIDGLTIEHRRTGLRWVNLVLIVCLVAWGCGCLGLMDAYARRNELGGGVSLAIGWIAAFTIPWFAFAFLLIRWNVDRKTLRLTDSSLMIETKLLTLRWCNLVPRNAITEIRYWERRSGDDDRYPDWELRIRYCIGDSVEHRTVRARLPFDHVEWLAKILGEWAGVGPIAGRNH